MGCGFIEYQVASDRERERERERRAAGSGQEHLRSYREDHPTDDPLDPGVRGGGGGVADPREMGVKMTGSMRDQISHENIHQGVSSVLSQLSELDQVMSHLKSPKPSGGGKKAKPKKVAI